MCALHYAAGLHKPYVALEKRFDLIVILVKKGVTIDCLTEATVDLPATIGRPTDENDYRINPGGMTPL
jgi:hypothetical protein